MFAKRKDTQLAETISALQLELDTCQDREICAKFAATLVELHTIQHAKHRTVSADTWATIAANLAGILIIVKHEEANVIASKALGFVQKLR